MAVRFIVLLASVASATLAAQQQMDISGEWASPLAGTGPSIHFLPMNFFNSAIGTAPRP